MADQTPTHTPRHGEHSKLSAPAKGSTADDLNAGSLTTSLLKREMTPAEGKEIIQAGTTAEGRAEIQAGKQLLDEVMEKRQLNSPGIKPGMGR